MGGNNFRTWLLIILLGISLAHPLYAEDVVVKRKQLSDINAELTQKRRELERISRQQNATLRNLAVINRQLKSTQHELSFADTQLKQHENMIKTNVSELNHLKETYLMRKNILDKRLRDIYKDNRLGYLNIVFSAQTMSEFLTRMFYLEKILQLDVRLLQQLSSQQTLVQRKESQLRQRYFELNEVRTLFARRKLQFRTQQVVQNRLYDDISRKRREYERQIAELEKNSKEIENLIVSLLSFGQNSATKGSGQFSWPGRGPLTSGYGYRRHPIFRTVIFHTGIDIGLRYGTAIAAADGGQVIFAGWWGGYGQATIIDHGNGFSTVYGHQSRIYVKKGQAVRKGQTIGAVGSTGYSTGPHLHFEIRQRGATVNPLRFL